MAWYAKYAALGIALLLVALVPARADGPAQDATSAALLAKHRAYVGWQFGDGTFSSMRISGNVTDEKGKKVQTFVWLSRGLAYNNTYTLLESANATVHTGYTGNLFWRADINGFPTPVYGDYAKYLASFTVLLQEGTTELPASFIKNETVDGKTLGVVRVTLTNGDAMDCYVDPQTGAYVQARIDPDGSYESTIHIQSYSDVLPGKKMIGAYRTGESKSTRTLEKFEPNVAVSDADLHPPPPTASWTFGSPDPTPITVTHDRLLLDATLNGVKGRFILDTGASSIFLDNKFADRAGAPVLKATTEAESMYGVVKTQVRHIDSLAIGGSTLHNALAYSEDFRTDDYRGLDWKGYDGLIGYDLFAGAIVKLGIYGAKLTILDPSADLSAERGLPILVDLSEGIPAIPMTFNKSVAVNAMLDTGNPGIVFMSDDIAKKHHLLLASLGCTRIESLAIGPITYTDQEVCLGGIFSSYMLIGLDFLKHFDYVFDYPHGRMFMTPNKN
ncbi:MAG TPA: aspartyl protease family protein [Candidatus Nitrosotalea sp.]|nr:aspartyl protease family protein [Candidatus Nitrosotalea sp.]